MFQVHRFELVHFCFSWVNVTTVVKGYGLLRFEGNMLGRAYPNHRFDVSDINTREVNICLMELVKHPERKYATELKFSVISF